MRKLRNEELQRLSPDEFQKAEKTPVILVLDNVRSLNNIGSIFRTADAFLVEAIYLCGITACPPHKDIQKTALGATETVRWKYFPSVLESIKSLNSDGYHIFSIEQSENSIPLDELELPGNKYAFIFGNEVEGVQQEAVNASKGCIEVPQYGSKHSLNIAVCAGIVVWQVFQLIKGISSQD